MKYKYPYSNNQYYEISMEIISGESHDYEIEFDFVNYYLGNASNCEKIILKSDELIDEQLRNIQNVSDYKWLRNYIIGIAFGINYAYEVYKTKIQNAKKLKIKISSLSMGIGFPVDIVVFSSIRAFWQYIDFVPLENVTYDSDGKSVLNLPHMVKNRFVDRVEVEPISFYNPMSEKSEYGSNSRYSWVVSPNSASNTNH